MLPPDTPDEANTPRTHPAGASVTDLYRKKLTPVAGRPWVGPFAWHGATEIEIALHRLLTSSAFRGMCELDKFFFGRRAQAILRCVEEESCKDAQGSFAKKYDYAIPDDYYPAFDSMTEYVKLDFQLPTWGQLLSIEAAIRTFRESFFSPYPLPKDKTIDRAGDHLLVAFGHLLRVRSYLAQLCEAEAWVVGVDLAAVARASWDSVLAARK